MKQLKELTEWDGLLMVCPQDSPYSEPIIEFSRENLKRLIDSHNQLILAVNELIENANSD